MIFLDANVLLRALVAPSDLEGQRRGEAAMTLLRQAGRGQVEVTTSDAVLAEVAYILTEKPHYNLSVVDAASSLTTVVRLRGFRRREKHAILRAFEIWTHRPRLGFVDALTAAYAQAPGVQLATFDTDFDGLPGINRWQPFEAD